MDSMEEIYIKHAKTVYGFLMSKTKDTHLAEELTQETFYQAVKSIKKFQHQSSVSTWLCGIAKNVWFDYLRKHKNTLPLEEALTAESDSLETQFFKDWDNIHIIKAIHGLKEPLKEVVYLRLIGNLSFRQIGEIMGKTENWARVNYYRGKERIVKEERKDEF